MILYHGSNVTIKAIDFEKSKPGKDFGVGFYLSPELEQAQEMAQKKALLFGGEPTVMRFDFDEEAAKADGMGNFYRVPADNRDLNYDKYFKEGDAKRATIEEFNSDNTRRLNLEEIKAKIASLEYIQNELNGIPNIVK